MFGGVAGAAAFKAGYNMVMMYPMETMVTTEVLVGAVDPNVPTNIYQATGFLINRYIVSPFIE